MFVRCPFCHKRVLKWWYAAHEQKHTERRSDGQMRDHITMPVAERYTGTLDGIPQAYRHPVCGVVTGMPEEIIRSYLVFPLLYSDGTFCCGCGTYVGMDQVEWVETGEVVLSYMARLRLEHLSKARRIVVRDPENDVVVTPEAVTAIRSAATGTSPAASVYLRLEISEEDNRSFAAQVVFGDFEDSDVLIKSTGMPVLVRKDQAHRIRGLVVDFANEGPRTGLSICRLSVPRE